MTQQSASGAEPTKLPLESPARPVVVSGKFGSQLPELPNIDRDDLLRRIENLLDAKNIAAYRSNVAEMVRTLKNMVPANASLLQVGSDRFTPTKVGEIEAGIVEVVEKVTDLATKQEVLLGIRDAAMLFYPETSLAVNRLAMLGHWTGFLQIVDEDFSGPKVVVPISYPDAESGGERWKTHAVTC